MHKVIGTNNDGIFVIRNGICSFISHNEYTQMIENGVVFQPSYTDTGKLCKILMSLPQYHMHLNSRRCNNCTVEVSADIMPFEKYKHHYDTSLYVQRRYTDLVLDYAVFLKVTIMILSSGTGSVNVNDGLFERYTHLSSSVVSYVREIPIEFYETLMSYGEYALSGFGLSKVVR